MSLASAMRRLRDRSPLLQVAHRRARGPYYRLMEACHPHGRTMALAGGLAFKLHPRLAGWGLHAYEPALAAIIDAEARPGATVVDIGAHVGLHTLRMSRRVGASGRVLAVEPSPANAALLARHLAWNECANTSVVAMAVADHAGQQTFSYRPDATDPAACANSLCYDIGGTAADVETTTIDALCQGLAPALVKIDVEGAELLSLRGARDLLARCAPTVIVAIHPEPMAAMGHAPSDVVRLASELGYGATRLDGSPVTTIGFEEIVLRRVVVPDA